MKARSIALRAARATLLVSLLVSCSGGGSADAPAASVSVPQVDFGPASNVDGKLRPVPNGFAFPNFTATAAPGNTFAGADLAAMFGDGPDVCASGTGDACSPTAEAASWAQMVNESRQSGHCEGFIVQSLSRFKGGQTPEAAQLPTSADVVQGILRGFATQFIPETRAESKGWRKTKVRDVLAELVTTLRDGTPDYVLGVYGDAGGHAILPYAVEFASADAARIQVYDSNWPGRNRFVDVDIAAGTWKFSFQGPDPENDPAAWTGGDGDMDLSSLDKRVSGTCPFCGGGTTALETMLTIRASAPTWSIDTERGTVTPQSSVDGVDVTQTRAAINGVFEYVVLIDPAAVPLTKKDSITLRLPPKSVAYALTPKGIARAATSGAKGTVGISEGTVSSTEGTTALRLAAGDEVIAADGLAAEITAGDDGVSGTARSGSGATVDASTTDDNRAILLTIDGNKPVTKPLEVTTKEDLPQELIGSVTATDLPPATERELANITPDPPYVLPVVATTTTAAVTTTAATTSGGSPATTQKPTSGTTVSGTTTTIGTTTVTTTAGTTATTNAPTTAAPTTSPPTTAAPTTTTNPINFTHSFRNGGNTGYTNSCGMEILDLTVSGAVNVSTVSATVGGTAASNAMNSGGNDWTFYSMPNKSPGSYTFRVTITADNGTYSKNLTIVYDADCDPNN